MKTLDIIEQNLTKDEFVFYRRRITGVTATRYYG